MRKGTRTAISRSTGKQECASPTLRGLPTLPYGLGIALQVSIALSVSRFGPESLGARLAGLRSPVRSSRRPRYVLQPQPDYGHRQRLQVIAGSWASVASVARCSSGRIVKTSMKAAGARKIRIRLRAIFWVSDRYCALLLPAMITLSEVNLPRQETATDTT